MATKTTEKTDEKVEFIQIPPLNIRVANLKLIGDSPLIVHNWSEKSKKEMLDKQMKKATQGKAAKDPQKDFEDSLYEHPEGGFGFPAVAFKNAAVTACTSLNKAITKVAARQAFHVRGELVKIDGDLPTPREDMVRVGMGTADIRYRGEFRAWSATLSIEYNPHALSLEQIVNLFNHAGFGVGVGEWRPEKNGQYGRFRVEVDA